MRRWAPLPALLACAGCFDFASLLAPRDRPDLAPAVDAWAPADGPGADGYGLLGPRPDGAVDLAADAALPDLVVADRALLEVPDGSGPDLPPPDLSVSDDAGAPDLALPFDLADAAIADLALPVDLASPDLVARPDIARTSARTYHLQASPNDVRTGDVDGDGDVDVLVSCGNARSVVTLLNDGTGVLSNGPGAPLLANSATGYFAEPRDFDGDGRIDVVVTLASSQLLFGPGRGDGTFPNAQLINLPGTATSLTAADFNGDKIVDVAVAVLAQPAGIVVLNGTAKGLAAPGKLQAAGTQLMPLAAADLDRDGLVDLVSGNTSLGTSILVLPGKGDGTFRASINLGALPIQGLAAADIDVDGTLDLVAGDPAQMGFAVLRGRGNFVFDPPVRTGSAGAGQAHVAVGDLMKSGAPDVILAESASDDVAVFKGKNGLSPKFRTSYNTGKSPSVVRLADLDRDGHLDILTADANQPSITVVLAP